MHQGSLFDAAPIAAPVSDAIIETIRKLQTLADRAGTQAEGEAAAAKMAALMARHNLSLSAVAIGADAPSDVAEVRIEAPGGWRARLLTGIGRAHHCRVINLGHGQLGLVGHPHNTDAVRDAFAWAAGTIDALAREGLAAAQANGDGNARWHARGWSNSFREGAVYGFCQAMHAAARGEESGPASSAIVAAVDAQVADKFRELYPRTVTRSSSVGGYGGYGAGRAAGAGMNRNGRVGAGYRALNG